MFPEDVKLKVLILCTSNKDRSPAVEKYLREIYPNSEFRSAGVNNYFCTKKGTHLITRDDLAWCNFILFAEDIHLRVLQREMAVHPSDIFKDEKFRFKILTTYGNNDKDVRFLDHNKKHYKCYAVINGGEYVQNNINDDYVLHAEDVFINAIEGGSLKDIIQINEKGTSADI